MKPRFLLLLSTVLFSLSPLGFAQNDQIVVFGGFSRLGYGIYADYSGPWVSAPLNGFEISGAFNPVRHFGAEVDFAHGYSPSNHWSSQTFMGGPRFSANIDRLGLFGHVLVGGLTFNGTGSQTTFALAFGGGVDAWFMRHIGARLIQFDYLHNNNKAAQIGFEPVNAVPSGPGNSYRIATGIVFRFGE